MFSVHAYLFNHDFNLDQLEVELNKLFTGDARFGLTQSRGVHPFSNAPYLIFLWPAWSFTAHVERGASVLADAEVIRTVAGCGFPNSDPIGRIRVVFGNDKGLDYTNHIIWVEEFLTMISGATLYDDAKRAWRP